MNYFVYILECADKTLYVGSTNNLEKRLHEHNHAKNGAHYTKIRRPVELKYFEEVATFSLARAREGELKRLTRIQKISLIHHTKDYSRGKFKKRLSRAEKLKTTKAK